MIQLDYKAMPEFQALANQLAVVTTDACYDCGITSDDLFAFVAGFANTWFMDDESIKGHFYIEFSALLRRKGWRRDLIESDLEPQFGALWDRLHRDFHAAYNDQ